MNGTMTMTMGGGGFMQNDGQAGTSAGGFDSNQEAKVNNIVAVTARSIKSLTRSTAMYMYRQKVVNVKVVGLVKTVDDQQSLKSVYTITDVNSDDEIMVELVKSAEDNSLFPQSPNIIENTYVRVIGKPKLKNPGDSVDPAPYILGFTVQPVTDINEAFAHGLEVIRDAMLLEKLSNISVSGDSYVPPSSNYSTYSSANSETTSYENGKGAVPGGFTKDQHAVLQILNGTNKEEGLHIKEIKNSVRNVNEEELKRLLTFLMGEGHVYNTIDDDHYKVTNS